VLQRVVLSARPQLLRQRVLPKRSSLLPADRVPRPLLLGALLRRLLLLGQQQYVL
jgi:hypothetical protein